ncbi:MAG: hypothetical protein NTZ39_08370 [Methanoregula sp.]|nr:hypothetical protein [Methanoregula sp.]
MRRNCKTQTLNMVIDRHRHTVPLGTWVIRQATRKSAAVCAKGGCDV